MVLPYQISKKLSAPQVRHFADWLGYIEYHNYKCNFTYTQKCYEDIDQIFLALQQLEPSRGKATLELWLCADRGRTFPQKQYYRFVDGRDEGLKNIDPDSPADFDDWYRNLPQGEHPWEACRGGNFTHISLYISDTKDGEYYLVVGGTSLWRSAEAIKFYLALHYAKLPVLFNKASLIKDRLCGEEKVGIVPEGVFPRYCSSWFPNEDIISFMNLSADHATEEIEHAEWYPLKKAKLLTQ